MNTNKHPAKIVGHKPLSYEVRGEVIEASKGAEAIALALSQGLAYEHPHRSVHNYVVQWGMSEASLQARLWQAYIQGRADEAATREASK